MPTLSVRLSTSEMEVLQQARIDAEHEARRRMSWRGFLIYMAEERKRRKADRGR